MSNSRLKKKKRKKTHFTRRTWQAKEGRKKSLYIHYLRQSIQLDGGLR